MKLRTKLTRIPTVALWFLRGSRYVFFVAGILALGYCSYVLLDAKLYQADQTRRFQQELKDSQAPKINGEPDITSLLPPSEATTPARSERRSITAFQGSALGRIEIPTIGLSTMILDGVDGRTLRRGVGHIPGTPLPGQAGNIGIAGHRDTFFRTLQNIRREDEIMLETLSGIYRYRVDSIEVVNPEETRVLANSCEEILTLVTCYPFSFVGPAPKRFVVRAHKELTRTEVTTQATGHTTTVSQGMR